MNVEEILELKFNKIYLFNTLIIPIDYNKYKHSIIHTYKIEPKLARELIKKAINERIPIISAIGHEATAKLMSMILDYPVKVNRISVFMEPDEAGIHLFLKKRLPEGTIIRDISELEKIGYWLVLSIVVNTK